MARVKDEMKSLHWDKRKNKPSWKRIAGSIGIGLALLGILMYFAATVFSLFGSEITSTSAHMLDLIQDNSWKVFGAGGAIYVGGEIASAFGDRFSEGSEEDYTVAHTERMEQLKDE